MYNKFLVCICSIALSVIFFSCKNENTPVIDKKLEVYFKLTAPANNSSAKLNDSLKVSFVISKQNVKLDSSQVFFDNNYISSLKNGVTSYSFLPSAGKLGVHKVSLKTFYEDGKNETLESNIKILSDVIPKPEKFTVVKTYPHSKADFTEGFEFYKGYIYESTGLEGKSLIKKYDLASGKTLKEIPLDKQYFGEGITIFDNKIYQLTWKNKKGFVYNLDDFKFIQNFTYNTEGWGMTNNGKELIMSDGTNKIYYMNPYSFAITSNIEVYDNMGAITNINELEYYKGNIYANVWRTFLILKIDAATGKVLGRMDLEELMKQAGNLQEIDVLNGITINPATGNLLVTGKLWNKIFEIKISE
ncbi:MAG: glutaminyl-peptide cyclotransferase [Bacteroidetes bacterium]|nr:glutaminyl-peptide cyclotransferase [Bacteroidota bacterium]